MPDPNSSGATTPRVRFAHSPTGHLHIGSARTFIFNWLYARHNDGTVILRIDDTDVGRNTQASLDSIFDGLKSTAESDRRATAGEPFVWRYRVPRESRKDVRFHDAV